MNFRHLLERHGLARQILEEINPWLADAGVLLKEGTLMDATIIDAPSSTKNKSRERDPEMHQTRKGNQWHFGMKAHIGVDAVTEVDPMVKTVNPQIQVKSWRWVALPDLFAPSLKFR